MSLKGFHILFISISALFCFLFALWLAVVHGQSPSPLDLVGAALSTTAGGVLVLYGIRFLKKFKHLQSH